MVEILELIWEEIFLKKKIKKKEENYLKLFSLMKKNLDTWKRETKKIINTHVKTKGKFLAKAFPGRAAILIKLLNLFPRTKGKNFGAWELKLDVIMFLYLKC